MENALDAGATSIEVRWHGLPGKPRPALAIVSSIPARRTVTRLLFWVLDVERHPLDCLEHRMAHPAMRSAGAGVQVLKDCGSELIEVADNGCGIAQQDYQAATLKHHTSKMAKFTDLDVSSHPGSCSKGFVHCLEKQSKSISRTLQLPAPWCAIQRNRLPPGQCAKPQAPS